MDWFNTSAGMASILGLFFCFLMWYFAYQSQKENRRADERLRQMLEGMQKTMEDGHKRLETIIVESHKRTQDIIAESNKRAQEMIEEGNKRMEKITEDGQKRTEQILSAMQSRWDISDEFNKRLLEKILDNVA
ncbi:MAG: hypothetical protein D6767_02155 [Candidatus Hydrogenedentota bacterium]|nr:MAG: hypothetical protein D6767_02155 [Candidatus Hydrogenedentota bacterium]